MSLSSNLLLPLESLLIQLPIVCEIPNNLSLLVRNFRSIKSSRRCRRCCCCCYGRRRRLGRDDSSHIHLKWKLIGHEPICIFRFIRNPNKTTHTLTHTTKSEWELKESKRTIAHDPKLKLHFSHQMRRRISAGIEFIFLGNSHLWFIDQMSLNVASGAVRTTIETKVMKNIFDGTHVARNALTPLLAPIYTDERRKIENKQQTKMRTKTANCNWTLMHSKHNTLEKRAENRDWKQLDRIRILLRKLNRCVSYQQKNRIRTDSVCSFLFHSRPFWQKRTGWCRRRRRCCCSRMRSPSEMTM